MEVTKPIVRTLIDTTTTPGYIYVGEAAITDAEEDPTWIICRISLSSPYDINYGRSTAPGNIDKKLKNRWTDLATLTY